MNILKFLILAAAPCVLASLWNVKIAGADDKPMPEATIDYDKFRDITTIESKFSYLTAQGGNPTVAMTAEGIFKGEKIKSKDDVLFLGLTFNSTADHWCFSGGEQVIFIIDGEKETFSTSEYSRSIGSAHESCTESMRLRIPAVEIRKLLLAKVIEGEAGPTQFKFTAENVLCVGELIEALRKCGAHISASSQASH